ncbi:MAG: DUF6580 family putative transport protein [Bryobacteraceae bacterium]
MTRRLSPQTSAVTLTALGALARLIPHPPNFAPVGSVSLFAGARIAGWQAYLVPLVLMLATNLVLGAMQGFAPFSKATLVVCVSFLISVWIGRRLRGPLSAGRFTCAVLLSSTQFFLVTNFGTWLLETMYPKTAAGLVACYLAAIPFFGRTVVSDFLYSGVLFGTYALIERLTNRETLETGCTTI